MEGWEFKLESFLPVQGFTSQPRRQRPRAVVLNSLDITTGLVRTASDSEDPGWSPRVCSPDERPREAGAASHPQPPF